ncbi:MULTISPECIES: hypothetical protein [Rhodanobacter]|jgi:hypothetical protein|uniref:hypothetical protein n=1 Tax=Rhodanobacter TaxID=75309 RepID=UPI00048484A8|nr:MULTISPECIES: hypothetical protein [Rhodanobacter]KZC19489.1 hypothetical protein RHOFW104R3_30870 [Rhodanobacter denitrificans]UJJ51653.1 hypothetical protein LRK52_02890 [Rhodanobacter denitrificans]UJM94397.1 hypothetical protein LRK32_02885 [Rhodanobacter denitrificans]UJM97927.1 hypothetical protein LRK44_02890 [Rhodanobacter denitrificans]UJN22659.1 hypothetical protein LRK54_05605 [Rhodanobacter denitrificans]
MTASNKLVAESWSLGQGALRELLSTIQSKRLGEILTEGGDIEQLRQVEQLGFSMEPAPTEYRDGVLRYSHA